MYFCSNRRAMLLGAIGAALALTLSTASRAQQVDPGWDLFQTEPGTSFNGVPFMGVPIGTFNFGGTIGTQNVQNTDTIVQRTGTVTSPAGTTPLIMNDLQLESSVPTNFGLGVGNYFITLQSNRAGGGPASTGTMTINFAPNTFSSSLDVFFDIRFGALNGPIAQSSDLVLTSSGTVWQHPAPAGSLLINGVNFNLNGTDNTTDFWPVGVFQEVHPNGATHVVTGTFLDTPEPGTFALFGAMAFSLLGCIRRRKPAA